VADFSQEDTVLACRFLLISISLPTCPYFWGVVEEALHHRGGLMIREQAGIGYIATDYQMGAGISHIHFPNGEIDSVQPYLSVQIPFTTIFASGWDATELSPGNFPQPLYDRDSSFAVSYKQYRGDSLFRSLAQPSTTISTIGVDWQHRTGRGFYYGLSTHGAYKGGADGYAEVMAAAGSRWHITQDTTFGVALALGSGGGGNVDTGGGALGSATLNLEQQLTNNLFLSIQGGYTGAMKGELRGNGRGHCSRHPLYDPCHHGLGERCRGTALCAWPLSITPDPAALL
jgi:hypothetical protein